MTDAQIFQVTGITLFSMGLTWILNPKSLRDLIREMANNKGTLLIMGMFALIVGYLILALHRNGSVVITILGWIALIKGFVIIIAPASDFNIFSLLRKLKGYFTFIPWLVFIVGIVALYFGYLA